MRRMGGVDPLWYARCKHLSGRRMALKLSARDQAWLIEQVLGRQFQHDLVRRVFLALGLKHQRLLHLGADPARRNQLVDLGSLAFAQRRLPAPSTHALARATCASLSGGLLSPAPGGQRQRHNRENNPHHRSIHFTTAGPRP